MSESDKPTFASVIKNSGFRSLWINQILVQLAYNTLNFALIIWVFKITGSSLAVSVLMLAIYTPSMIFGVFAGVFVDAIDKRKIILLVDIFLSLAFFWFVFIKKSYPLILLNTFFINSLAQFFMPSESSSIPLLVPKNQLFLANSLFSLTLYASLMVGFSFGGPILNTFGLNAIFFLGSLLLLVAFLFSQSLPAIKSASTVFKLYKLTSDELGQMLKLSLAEIGETFRFIKKRLNITVAIILMSAVQGVVGVLAVMLPSYLEKALLIHASDASYFVMLPTGLGMVIGALLAGKLFHRLPRRSVVIPAIISAGVLFILIGFTPFLARNFRLTELSQHVIRPRYFFRAPSLSSILAILAFLLGFATASIIIPCQTVIQENTDEKNRGKIFATLGAIMTAVSALPIVLAGGLSDLFGVTPIFISLGIIVVAAGFLTRRPSLIFGEDQIPVKVKEFLGEGHWADVSQKSSFN